MITKEGGLQIGLVISLISGVVAAIWWAATLTTKLDSVILALENIRSTDAAQTAQIAEIRSKVDKIELVGSQKANDVEKKLVDIEKRLDSHMINDKVKP